MLEACGRPRPLYRSIDGEAVFPYALLVAAQWKRVAARQDADATRFRHAKRARPWSKTHASAVVAEEDIGRLGRLDEPVNHVAPSKPPLPECPRKHRDRVQSVRSADDGRERLAVVDLRVAPEREDFQAFRGDDLAAGDQQQPCVGVPLGHQAFGFVGTVERPAVASLTGRVAKSPKVVHARRFGEQQPTRVFRLRPANARDAPEVGERAVEETIAVEVRVVVDMAVDQKRPADDVIAGYPMAHRHGRGPVTARWNCR